MENHLPRYHTSTSLLRFYCCFIPGPGYNITYLLTTRGRVLFMGTTDVGP